MKEVIRWEEEKGKWVLYSADGSKQLGEFDTKGEAEQRERQIQFFKHQEAVRRLGRLVEQGNIQNIIRAWRDWAGSFTECVKQLKGQPGISDPEALCAWLHKEAEGKWPAEEAAREAWVKLALADEGLRERLLSEVGRRHTGREYQIIEEVIRLMVELHGEIEDLDAMLANVQEAVGDFSTSVMVALYPPQAVAEQLALDPAQYPDRIAPEDLHVTLIYLGDIVEIGSSRKDEIMRGLAQIASGEPFLQGRINGLGRFLTIEDEGQTALYASVDCRGLAALRQRIVDTLGWNGIRSPSEHGFTPHITLAYLPAEAPTPDLRPVGDVTFEAVYLVWGEERIAFELQGEVSNVVTAVSAAGRGRPLTDVWDRSLTEARIDDAGNLSGVVVVEGLSANGNYYTRGALESGADVFAGKPIYADHPTRTEERDRPERSVRDLVGRLPGRDGLFVEALSEAGSRLALKYRGGRLSETAGWLATLIREGIAGDQSINAHGRGREQENHFVVEAFTAATSLDFVTQAAAGGQAFLESHRTTIEETDLTDLSGVTFEQLVEARPDIVDDISSRERRKAYGEKAELIRLQEVNRMAVKNIKEAQTEIERLSKQVLTFQRQARQQKADAVIGGVLAESGLPKQAQTRVRRLVESTMRRFVEQEGEEAPPATEPPGELAPTSPDLGTGDPPALELPPDVATLPEEAQQIWLTNYTANLAEGEETAVHKAWSAVYADGWLKDEASGEWFRMEPEPPTEPAPEPAPAATVTEEALRKAVRQAILAERAYLAQATGAGRITGMGGAPQPLTEAQQEKEERERRLKAYRDMGLTEAEAAIAVEGR